VLVPPGVLLLCLLSSLAACTRERDRFWPDTEQGLLSLSSPRVLAGDPDRIIQILLIERVNGPAGIPKLNRHLRVGDEVVTGITVPRLGKYREGGGWIFKGRKFYGRTGAAGDLLSVASSHPAVLAAEVDRNGDLALRALAPGRSALTLVATMSSRYAELPPDAPTYRDSVTFSVEP